MKELQDMINRVQESVDFIMKNDPSSKIAMKLMHAITLGNDSMKRFEYLNQFFEDCLDCGGSGEGNIIAGDPREWDCKRCKGSGKTPLTYLPDKIVQMILSESNLLLFRQYEPETLIFKTISPDYETDPAAERCKIVMTLIKQSNNLWKLEYEVKVPCST